MKKLIEINQKKCKDLIKRLTELLERNMKKLLQLLVSLLFFLNPAGAQENINDQTFTGKILIVYFSRADENYISGDLKKLTEGNTSVVAHKIQNITGADLFEIKAVTPYPEGYYETTDIARKELNSQARPEIAGSLPNISKYDVIIIGHPIWWGTMPTIVMNFLEQCNFSRKKVISFCTHEGSGFGESINDLKNLCKDADFGESLAIEGGKVNSKETDTDIKKWLSINELI